MEDNVCLVLQYQPYLCYELLECQYGEIIEDMGRIMNYRPVFSSYGEKREMEARDGKFYDFEAVLGVYIAHSTEQSSNLVIPIWKTP